MKLRLKLIFSILILYVMISVLYFFFCLDLVLVILPKFTKQSEQLSLKFYNETQMIRTRSFAEYISRNVSKLHSVLYITQDLMNNPLNVQGGSIININDIKKFQPGKIVWWYNNITDINQIQDQRVIQSIQNAKQLNMFLDPLVKYGLLNQMNLICYGSLIQIASTYSKSFTFFNWTSETYLRIFIARDSLQYYILKSENCEIQVNSDPKNLLNIIVEPQGVQSGFIIDGVVIEIDNQQFKVGNMSQILDTQKWQQYFKFDDYIIDQNGCKIFDPYFQRIDGQQMKVMTTMSQYYMNPFKKCENDIPSHATFFKILNQDLFYQFAGQIYFDDNYYLQIELIMGSILFCVFIYVYGVSVRVGLSFELPIKLLISILQKNVEELQKESLSITLYKNYLNSEEIIGLFKSIMLLITSLKFFTKANIFDEDRGAHYLIQLSAAKNFYKERGNILAVSICANNIAQIHFKNKRYLEAMNEQRESIMLADSILSLNSNSNKLNKQKNPMLNSVVSIQQNLHGKRNPSQVELLQYSGLMISQRSNTDQDQLIDKNNLTQDQKTQIKTNKRLLQLTILFRKYQFTKILFKFSTLKNQILIVESIDALKELYEDSVKFKTCNIRSIKCLQVKVLLRLSYCYAQLNMLYEASTQITEAKSILKQLNKPQLNEPFDGMLLNQFQDLPLHILIDKIQAAEALILMIAEQYQKSSLKLVEILEYQKFNDIKLQRFTLRLLYQIFAENGLNTQPLVEYRKQNIEKQLELIIMIDYSSQISDEQISIAHSLVQFILKQLRKGDQVSLFLFNEALFEIFSKQDPISYQKLLLQTLRKYFIPQGGEGRLFQNLRDVINNFSKVNNEFIQKTQSEYQQQLLEEFFQAKQQLTIGSQKMLGLTRRDTKGNIQTSSEWINFQKLRIVCLFTEGCKQYTQEDLESIKCLYKHRSVSLIVFNIANSNWNHQFLKELAFHTQGIVLNDEKETIQYFDKLRPAPNCKKQYIEFL